MDKREPNTKILNKFKKEKKSVRKLVKQYNELLSSYADIRSLSG